jgi:ribosomal protein L7Ae-like RNA K-turn-binding protein
VRSNPAPRSPEAALLGLLGLAARARALVSGTEQVRAAVRDGSARLVILAADAAAGQQAKLVPLLEARKVAHFIGPSRDELGGATGRGPVSALGVTDAGFARRASELLAALAARQAQAQEEV